MLTRPGTNDRLMPDGDQLMAADGSSYAVVNGVPHLYDAPVSPILLKDMAFFKMLHDNPSAKQPNHDDVIFAYQRAKGVNTNFMFSAIEYDDVENLNVVELGVGGADLIKKWAALTPHAYGLDFFTWEMEEGLANHVAEGGRPFIPVSAVMASLPFPDASLDVVYMHAALHHALPLAQGDFRWSDPKNMVDCLKEIRRTLKPEGVFFLMGEGFYPNDVIAADRVHEVRCQSDDGWPYEAHYTIPEYEAAFREAGVFPTLFSWQEDFRLVMDAYVGGVARRIVDEDVGVDDYERVNSVAMASGVDALPSWMRWRRT